MPDAVLVEKILRVQPDVHKIYLVVRAIDEASAKQRVQL
jgi:fatty acyl-CoA reductase